MINCFYVFNGILQSIPAISTNSPLASWIPLIFTIALGMVREGISDYKRYSNDKQTNNRKTQIWNSATKQFEIRKWSEVLPGQVLLIKDKAFIPADVLVLASSDSHGQAYVQTA